jgi:hypothetical protein
MINTKLVQGILKVIHGLVVRLGKVMGRIARGFGMG